MATLERIKALVEERVRLARREVALVPGLSAEAQRRHVQEVRRALHRAVRTAALPAVGEAAVWRGRPRRRDVDDGRLA